MVDTNTIVMGIKSDWYNLIMVETIKLDTKRHNGGHKPRCVGDEADIGGWEPKMTGRNPIMLATYNPHNCV